MLLPFRREGGFGADKAGGVPCGHLDVDDHCTIHDTLRRDGWSGCATFDCFGAGQHVSQVIYGGVSWREGANLGEMAAVLSVVRQLHEMLSHLAEVGRRAPDPDAARLSAEIVALTHAEPITLLTADLDTLRSRVSPVLRAATVRLHGRAQPMPADLVGADLAGADLSRADLRGASLVRADLRGAELARADLLGADLRDADVRGARLGQAWFVSQPQLNGSVGDGATTIPSQLTRPAHWADRSRAR
ncbi:pentapeptide repeat-containing protein [Nocardioides coralli]|uniref:pentapeptide repeat-containing protein n=1 Tax=Nocardioides coralli TaxID=2872154 RepID=UPI0020176724|nr:pentapeptide repeat-containing protein [Nocardioides coralli]